MTVEYKFLTKDRRDGLVRQHAQNALVEALRDVLRKEELHFVATVVAPNPDPTAIASLEAEVTAVQAAFDTKIAAVPKEDVPENVALVIEQAKADPTVTGVVDVVAVDPGVVSLGG